MKNNVTIHSSEYQSSMGPILHGPYLRVAHKSIDPDHVISRSIFDVLIRLLLTIIIIPCNIWLIAYGNISSPWAQDLDK